MLGVCYQTIGNLVSVCEKEGINCIYSKYTEEKTIFFLTDEEKEKLDKIIEKKLKLGYERHT